MSLRIHAMTFPRRVLAVGVVFFASTLVMAEDAPSLRTAYEKNFDIGMAISAAQLEDPSRRALDLVRQQCSVVTAENAMKWDALHPQPGKYDFRHADMLVAFAEENDIKVIGHTLVWHSQCPDWVFKDEAGQPLGREALIERLRDHIQTVVGRYKGRVMGWDVVNEAIEDDGSWRDSKWRRQIGDDYLEVAFRLAHEADSDAELYYNDYSMTQPGKRKTVSEMVKTFQERGVPIHGVGLQGHWALDYPSEQEIDDSLSDYGKLGVKVMITELDMNVLPRPSNNQGADVSQRAALRAGMDPYREGLPPEVAQKQADRYAMFFRQFKKHDDAIGRVTFWGVDDGQSWHNNWPVRGRVAHSLLFDRNLAPKPAFWSVLKVAAE